MRIERGGDPGPFTDHRDYKPHLRLLFRERCAYCLTPDDCTGGLEGMTVDHFRPQSRYPELRGTWTNLYYACGICNSHYKRDRPTDDEERAGERFVNVCAEESDDHFRLSIDQSNGDHCKIVAVTAAARFSIHALHLDRRKGLRDFWRELDKCERRQQHMLQTFNGLIAHLDANAHDLDPSDVQELRHECASCRDECSQRLKEIRNRRPFPIV